MKYWRSRLARLNQKFDTYIKENYKVVDYQFKRLPQRMSSITWKPYGYHKKIRAFNSRKRCLIQRGLYVIEVKSALQKGRRKMEFDSDSYEILIDNCCSHSLTNNINDFIEPPVKSKDTCYPPPSPARAPSAQEKQCPSLVPHAWAGQSNIIRTVLPTPFCRPLITFSRLVTFLDPLVATLCGRKVGRGSNLFYLLI